MEGVPCPYTWRYRPFGFGRIPEGSSSHVASAQGNFGHQCTLGGNRGYGTGISQAPDVVQLLWIPLMLMYGDVDIPVIQLSLIRGLEAAQPLALGRALSVLLEENILVIGSGFSFHNMRAFSFEGDNIQDDKNDAFQNWLVEVCTGNISQKERERQFLLCEKAPYARYCHHREEHLLPLLVCLSMAQKPAKVVFDDYILGKHSLAFQW